MPVKVTPTEDVRTLQQFRDAGELKYDATVFCCSSDGLWPNMDASTIQALALIVPTACTLGFAYVSVITLRAWNRTHEPALIRFAFGHLSLCAFSGSIATIVGRFGLVTNDEQLTQTVVICVLCVNSSSLWMHNAMIEASPKGNTSRKTVMWFLCGLQIGLCLVDLIVPKGTFFVATSEAESGWIPIIWIHPVVWCTHILVLLLLADSMRGFIFHWLQAVQSLVAKTETRTVQMMIGIGFQLTLIFTLLPFTIGTVDPYWMIAIEQAIMVLICVTLWTVVFLQNRRILEFGGLWASSETLVSRGVVGAAVFAMGDRGPTVHVWKLEGQLKRLIGKEASRLASEYLVFIGQGHGYTTKGVFLMPVQVSRDYSAILVPFMTQHSKALDRRIREKAYCILVIFMLSVFHTSVTNWEEIEMGIRGAFEGVQDLSEFTEGHLSEALRITLDNIQGEK